STDSYWNNRQFHWESGRQHCRSQSTDRCHRKHQCDIRRKHGPEFRETEHSVGAAPSGSPRRLRWLLDTPCFPYRPAEPVEFGIRVCRCRGGSPCTRRRDWHKSKKGNCPKAEAIKKATFVGTVCDRADMVGVDILL